MPAMSLACQFTIMSPTASSAPADQQPSRLNQRRNAMANVMDGVSDADISLIRDHALASSSLSTAGPTCTTMRTSSDRMSSVDSSSNGLGALAYQTPSPSSSHSTSPPLSPSWKHRRNAVPDALADVDQALLRRIREAYQQSSPRHDVDGDADHHFSFH